MSPVFPFRPAVFLALILLLPDFNFLSMQAISSPPPAENAPPLIPKFGRQAVLVLSPAWSSTQSRLYCLSRKSSKDPWKIDFSCPAVLGKNGLAWGLGLHGWRLNQESAKTEGDKKSPAGVFRITAIFGYAPESPNPSGPPYIAVGPKTRGVDDPASPFYNRIVEENPETTGKWKSAEIMLMPDGLYKQGLVIGHNDPALAGDMPPGFSPVPGREALGSCIFIHVWRSPSSPTVGCTGLAEENLGRLISWLRRDHQPVLIQLPQSEYTRLSRNWQLPDISP